MMNLERVMKLLAQLQAGHSIISLGLAQMNSYHPVIIIAIEHLNHLTYVVSMYYCKLQKVKVGRVEAVPVSGNVWFKGYVRYA